MLSMDKIRVGSYWANTLSESWEGTVMFGEPTLCYQLCLSKIWSQHELILAKAAYVSFVSSIS